MGTGRPAVKEFDADFTDSRNTKTYIEMNATVFDSYVASMKTFIAVRKRLVGAVFWHRSW